MVSISLGIFGVISRIVLKGITLSFWFVLFQLSPFQIETSVMSLFILYLLNEFIYYWFHRWSHENKWLWATHVNHHSSTKMNLTVATRTPFMNVIYHSVFWLPLPLMGFHPIDVLAVETIGFFFAYLQHTTLIPKLGFLEWFLNTPSHHRVHHAANKEYLNKNYGNTLILFDRIFGTFKNEETPPVYGLEKNPINRSLQNIIFHEWKELLQKPKP